MTFSAILPLALEPKPHCYLGHPTLGMFTRALVSLIIVAASANRCPAVETEDKVLAELCRNGLAQTAYLYADAERQRVVANRDAYARWTMRLMEIAAQDSLNKNASTADLNNKQITDFEAIFADFKKGHADNRRYPWVAWQHARCILIQTQGQLSRWLAAPAQTAFRDQALEHVRTILTELDALAKDLKERTPVAAKQGTNEKTHAPANELNDLQVDTVLLKCEALLVRSQLYPSGSRDRIAAATEVEQNADKILNQASREWTNRDKLELARSSAWLDTGRPTEAIKELKRLANEATEINVTQRACSIAIEYLLEKGQLSAANEFLNLLRKGPEGPERYLAEIRFLVAELANKSKPQSQKQVSAVLELSNKLGETYGEYWRWRADALMVGNVTSDAAPAAAGVELLKAEVKQLVAAEKNPAAMEKLVQAARNEQALNHGSNSLELATLAGALSEQFPSTGDVIELLSSLSTAFRDVPNAPKVHQQAIRLSVAKLRRDVQNKQLQSQYEDLLKQQIGLFPDAAETADAVQWYKEWMIGRSKTFPMAEVFRKQLSASRLNANQRVALLDWLHAIATDRFSAKPHADSEIEEEINQIEQSQPSWASDVDKRFAQSVLLMAKTLQSWGDRKSIQDAFSVAEGLANQDLEETSKQLVIAVQAIHNLRLASIDSDGIASRINRLQTTTLDVFSAELFAPIAHAIIEAYDALSSNDKKEPKLSAWLGSTLGAAGQLIAMENHRLPKVQAIASRCQAFAKGDAGIAISQLKALREKSPRDPFISWMLANQMAESEPQEATAILGQIIISAPKGSETFLSARWLQLRLTVQSEDPVKARRAAQLVLATYNLNALWRSRYEKLAKGP